jgi:hypothetical protein
MLVKITTETPLFGALMTYKFCPPLPQRNKLKTIAKINLPLVVGGLRLLNEI